MPACTIFLMLCFVTTVGIGLLMDYLVRIYRKYIKSYPLSWYTKNTKKVVEEDDLECYIIHEGQHVFMDGEEYVAQGEDEQGIPNLVKFKP